MHEKHVISLFSITLLTVLACSDAETVVITVDSSQAEPAATTSTDSISKGLTNAALAAPEAILPAAVIEKADDSQSADFLSLFVGPTDTVRLASTNAIRLWDLIGVAETPKGDPRKRVAPGSSSWTQVGGTKVVIKEPTTTSATAVITDVAQDHSYTFRVSIANASGNRSMDVNVIVLKR
jgi:hypothetical protein